MNKKTEPHKMASLSSLQRRKVHWGWQQKAVHHSKNMTMELRTGLEKGQLGAAVMVAAAGTNCKCIGATPPLIFIM